MNLTVAQIENIIIEKLEKVSKLERNAKNADTIREMNTYIALANRVKLEIMDLEILKEKRAA